MHLVIFVCPASNSTGMKEKNFNWGRAGNHLLFFDGLLKNIDAISWKIKAKSKKFKVNSNNIKANPKLAIDYELSATAY